MTRTDNDTWDLASSVGATATLVAAARAAASRETEPLIDDPFAEPLVRAVGIDFFTKMASGDLPTPDDQTAMGVTRMTDNMAVADEVLRRVLPRRGQGRDPAGRSSWPPASTPAPTGWTGRPTWSSSRSTSLRSSRSRPRPWPSRAPHRPVTAARWPWICATTGPARCATPASTRRRPRPGAPKACWAISPRRPRTACSTPSPTCPRRAAGWPSTARRRRTREEREESRERMETISAHWRDNGFDLDFANLVYLGERNEAGAYLAGHGWQARSAPVNELLTASRRGSLRRRRTDGQALLHQRRLRRRPVSRSDADSWDLATSVGTTATMVAAARAVASREDDAAHRRPVRRAAGPRRRHRLLHQDGRRRYRHGGRRHCGHRPGDDRRDGGAHPLLRRLLPRRRRGRSATGRHPGLRAGLPVVSTGLAGRHGGLRDRPAARSSSSRPRRWPPSAPPPPPSSAR